jgi:hypothetical protein
MVTAVLRWFAVCSIIHINLYQKICHARIPRWPRMFSREIIHEFWRLRLLYRRPQAAGFCDTGRCDMAQYGAAHDVPWLNFWAKIRYLFARAMTSGFTLSRGHGVKVVGQ